MADIYDNVFHTVLYDCRDLILPLINLVFGEHYTGDERVEFLANDLYVSQPNDQRDKRLADSILRVYGRTQKTYHWECQSRNDSTMLLRLFEYDASIAKELATIEGENDDTLVVSLPNTAVLYLRYPKTSKLSSYKYRIQGSGGELVHEVPILRLQQYTLDDIFQKGLLMLLPFYIFTKEADFGQYDADPQKLAALEDEYREAIGRLDELVSAGTMTDFCRATLIETSVDVIDAIAKKYQNITKGMDQVMYATLIDTRARKLRDEGWNKGWSKGWNEGRAEGWNEGRAEGWNEGRTEGWNEGKAEGRNEGRTEGKTEGRDEAQVEIFRNLVAFGMSREDAMRLTEISDELAEAAMQPVDA